MKFFIDTANLAQIREANEMERILNIFNILKEIHMVFFYI